jgi:diacylglycerol kinase (ATP)
MQHSSCQLTPIFWSYCGYLSGNVHSVKRSLLAARKPLPSDEFPLRCKTLLLSSAHMRTAAILGLGCSAKNLRPFQTDPRIDWRIGMPAAGDEAEVVLIFGGDGTIHRHLSQLVKLGLPVLIVPAGSGNDFARALGIRRLRHSLEAWQRFCAGRDNVRAIDLGVISPVRDAGEAPAPHDPACDSVLGTRNYFCSVAGVGLDSEVARRANALPRWLRGHGGYALTLAPAILRFAPFPMKTSTSDGAGGWTTRSAQPTILAAFANTSTYGDGMRIAPHAQMDDGQLDVCVIGGVDPFKLVCMFPTVYFGRHLSIREVEYFQAASVCVETEAPLDIYADGEYVCRTPVEIFVERAALRVVVHPSQSGPEVGMAQTTISSVGSISAFQLKVSARGALVRSVLGSNLMYWAVVFSGNPTALAFSIVTVPALGLIAWAIVLVRATRKLSSSAADSDHWRSVRKFYWLDVGLEWVLIGGVVFALVQIRRFDLIPQALGVIVGLHYLPFWEKSFARSSTTGRVLLW